MFEALGFNPVEERVYELLVAHGRLSRAEVVAKGDLEPRLADDALEWLVGKGLVRRLAGPDHEFVVAPPEHAFEVLIAEQMNALQTVRTHSAELAARVREVAQLVDPTKLIEIVSGEGSVRQLFLQVLRSTREKLEVFDTPPYAVAPSEVPNGGTDRLIAAGVRVRTVFDRSLLEDPVHVRRILHGVEAGEQARVSEVPLKLAIIDREWAMLPLLHAAGTTPEATVIVRRSVLLDSLVALFESVWEGGGEIRPTGEVLELRGTHESDLRQLARLLASGMTETAIGHHLGVSQRTVRRRIKDLMHELKVESRFQAGVRAAERGWL